MSLSRTYHAIGLDWQLWIELEDGTIVLTPIDNTKPAAVARDAKDASATFRAEKGPAADRGGPNGTLSTFDQTFPAHVMKNMILMSNKIYRDGQAMPPPP